MANKKIRVLWLIEHVAREMDVACAVRCWAKAKFDIDIKILHIYLHAKDLMEEPEPDLLVFPFFYRSKGLAINDYLSLWPNVRVFNLAWEQIHYPAHELLKSPRDEFAQLSVRHHAWGPFYKNYLLGYGVPEEHIFLNGHPAYQLYLTPYREFFSSRTELAHQYNLDYDKKWVFFPENYRWAFTNDRRVASLVKQGADKDTIEELRYFCHESLKTAVSWCNHFAAHPNLEIIFRPRPAVNTADMINFMHEYVGAPSEDLNIIKEGTVREWTLASDVIISSYSTTLIEAAVTNKPAYMAEPLALPKGLRCSWNDIAVTVETTQDFERCCFAEKIDDERLSSWAHNEMLSRGDSIEHMADYVCRLATGKLDDQEGKTVVKPKVKKSKKSNYFNVNTHEKDMFTVSDVDKQTALWWKHLTRNDIIKDTTINPY